MICLKYCTNVLLREWFCSVIVHCPHRHRLSTVVYVSRIFTVVVVVSWIRIHLLFYLLQTYQFVLLKYANFNNVWKHFTKWNSSLATYNIFGKEFKISENTQNLHNITYDLYVTINLFLLEKIIFWYIEEIYDDIAVSSNKFWGKGFILK